VTRRWWLAVGLATPLVAGCGQLGDDWSGLRPERPPELTARDAAPYPPGSPERAFTQWFSAIQRRDAEAFARQSAPSANLPLANLRRLWAADPPQVNASPQITDVIRRGGTATVYLRLVTRWRAPNGRTVVFRRIDAVSFVRDGGAWRVPDTLAYGRLIQAQNEQRLMIEDERL
jgi:hypothetical protein